MNTDRLQGKVVVIVGGTSGLGLSAAQACVRAGAATVIVGRDKKRCAAAAADLGKQSLAIAGDACDPQTATVAIQEAVATFGGFHGLYHVAGGSGRRQGDGPLDQLSDQGWDHTMRLNLDSVFYSNRAAIQQFLRQGTGGSVVNMASVLADSPSPRFFATHAYATSKAATIGMTKAAAAFYASQDIRLNVIAPALVDTPLAKRATEDDAIMRYVATKQPLDGGRIGVPADVDDAVVFFLSDEARFVTGQVLRIDGSWSLTEGQYEPTSDAATDAT
ncbi:MAG: SDR family oxidoreductase [Pirellulaceae bacterium]|nr:SDR family oxidoreductase [Pirellulaceae bacterium]